MAWDLGVLACEPRALHRLLFPVFNHSVAACPRDEKDKRSGNSEYDYYGLAHCVPGSASERGGCALCRLFAHRETNPHGYRLGTLDASGIYLMALVNRSDQGWWWRPKPRVCPGAPAVEQ